MFARVHEPCNFPIQGDLVVAFSSTARTEAAIHESLKRHDEPVLWLQTGIREQPRGRN